ncbi:hypothetical protein M378DRAFT_106084 [Amanita muscaria Koide BX008]|uniref:Uncharacterized protein n=1 Tax=Amanita muscaria (strain Koide BX008) TaxID=946122 RepID=A0A0C2WRX8_AMAMK|nr:hypothetical protein M378DRAFT_106084 [Amanita muscaria Koide BX008]
MFKRVEKRIKKQEEDRALDIDHETREALGLNETDSDESDDSEESDVFDQQDEDESEEWGGLGYEASDVGEGGEHVEDDSVDEHDTSEEEDLGDVGEKRQVSFQAFTVDQALKEPIYAHPSQSKASLCALCPGKTLIGPLAISQHRESNAHARRSKRMSELAALPGNKDRDFSDLLREMDGTRVETQGESKRAEKKRKAAEKWKVKREKRKEREKAKKEKQKQDAEGKEAANGKRPTRPDHAALSDTKEKKDGKHKAKSAETTPTTKAQGREEKQTKKSGREIPRPSASNVNDQANKRKRKPETEKEKGKGQGPAEKTQAPPSKKRKTGADNTASPSEKIDITRQIKNIAKSATKRAHQALDKANKGGSLKTKGGMKKKSG